MICLNQSIRWRFYPATMRPLSDNSQEEVEYGCKVSVVGKYGTNVKMDNNVVHLETLFKLLSWETVVIKPHINFIT